MVLTNLKFETLVSKMMKDKGISRYEIDITNNSKPGENGFTGHIAFFKVISKSDNKTYDLVMKIAQTENEIQKPITEMNFERELFFYTQVIPSIQSHFSHKINYIPELFWHHYDDEDNILVFNNFDKEGFSMVPKEEPLNLQHTKIVIKTLGKFHGEIMVFLHENKDVFNKWKPHLTDIRHKLMNTFGFEPLFQEDSKQLIETLRRRGEHYFAEKYEKKLRNFFKYFSSADEMDRIVINHGDCWINNIVFNFNNKNLPTQCKLFDFQYSSINTPVEDLSFFLFTACDDTTLEHFDELMQDYYGSLTKTILNLGGDPEEIFPFSQLKQHWKKYGITGLLLAVAVVKLLYSEKEEIELFMKMLSGDKLAFQQVLKSKMKKNDIIFDRLTNIFIQYGKRFFD